MTREAIAPVRRDIPADLDDELVAVVQLEQARIAAPAGAVAEDGHRAVEAEQLCGAERPAPHSEDVRERRCPVEADHAGGVDRPHARAAARADDPATRAASAPHADRGRDDHDAAVGEELQVHTAPREERARVTRGVDRRLRVVRRPNPDRRRHERKHCAHGIAALAVLALAGCGGGGSPSIAVQPAREYRLEHHVTGTLVARRPSTVTFRIIRPDGSALTAFRRGSGPHTGVHVIFVRSDLASIVHRHPAVHPDGTFGETVTFPSGGTYRVVIDAYPQQASPQPNFQLFTTLRVRGPTTSVALPPFSPTETVDGYRFTLHGKPQLRAIEPAFLSFSVTRPDGSAAHFTSWYGALAHAIFFRQGTLDYFHTHVCAPGAAGCTSALGAARVTGTSTTPGKLSVGVLVPVAGTWRLFLQCRVDGHVLTAPFTLRVR